MRGEVAIGPSIYGVYVIDGSLCSRVYGTSFKIKNLRTYRLFVKLRNDCSFSQYNSSYYDSSDYNITMLCYFYKVMSL